MQKVQVYVKQISKKAQESLQVNGGQTTLVRHDPQLMLVYFQAYRYEVKGDQRLYWLKNGDIITIGHQINDDFDVIGVFS